MKLLRIIIIPILFLSFFKTTNGQQEEVSDGYVKFYYPNGQVSSEGMMKDGKPDGYWKTYYVTGVIKSEGKRTNYMLDSIWVFYNQKGDTTQKISYMYGKKNGYSITYGYENLWEGVDTGVVIAKELYINDKKEGISYYYYPDGNLKSEVPYVNGKKQGLSKEYDENGIIITLVYYHNGYMTDREEINRRDAYRNKQGTWKEFYPDGKVKKEEVYKDNLLDGLYKTFNESGNLLLVLNYSSGKLVEEVEQEQMDVDIRNEYDDQNRLIASGAFRNNIPVGIHRTYDKEGNVINSKIYNESGNVVAEGIIDVEGNREGPWKEYYQDGKIRATGNYQNNERSGKWVFYYKNGKVEQTGDFIRGRTTGIWTWYYENGIMSREESYFNGKEDGIMIEYSTDGRILTRGDYVEGEKEGEWYYRVGDHIETGYYITGLRDGLWRYFYNDSTLKFEGKYLQGNPDGKHKLYYENGVVKEERYYIMGIREKNWKRYDEEGNLTMTITYQNDSETRINGIKVELPEREIKLIQ
ncbi:MAG: hypothetical protein AMS27_03840 [Bacteroides sp. SM23_62_1]|nr:MAG: hypothetical protein AMS27_03840 [Bacteroides sp. SM23_62_1]